MTPFEKPNDTPLASTPEEVTVGIIEGFEKALGRILSEVDEKIDAVSNSPRIIGRILDELLGFVELVQELRMSNPRTPIISLNNLTIDSAHNSYFTELKGEEGIRKGIGEAIIELLGYQKLVGLDGEAFKNYQKAINLCYMYANKLLHSYKIGREDFIFTSDRTNTEDGDEITSITTITKGGKVSVRKKITSDMGEA